MKPLPEKLYRGVASMSRHHMEAQNHGTCTPKGGDNGDGLMTRHIHGATDNSRFTSWTETRSVAEGYARSSPNGMGVVLEINFAKQIAPFHEYRQVGNLLGEDEWLIEGKIGGVRVTKI